MTHTPVLLNQHYKWTLMVSSYEKTVKRLVVFVHGFGGTGLGTWGEFTSPGDHRQWWLESDMLFISYKSIRENPVGVAHRIRDSIDDFYPNPYPPAMEIGDSLARADITTPYEELVLVGHSLGGLIIRLTLLDVAMDWESEGGEEDSKPEILSATTRLFSPASAGFRPAGILGMVEASPLWTIAEFFLRGSSAFRDMQPNSKLLESTQERTEELAGQPGFDALRALIAWANPEKVVQTHRYRTDRRHDSWDNTNHISVCKPIRDTFESPWIFVEKGRVLR